MKRQRIVENHGDPNNGDSEDNDDGSEDSYNDDNEDSHDEHGSTTDAKYARVNRIANSSIWKNLDQPNMRNRYNQFSNRASQVEQHCPQNLDVVNLDDEETPSEDLDSSKFEEEDVKQASGLI